MRERRKSERQILARKRVVASVINLTVDQVYKGLDK